MNGLAPKFTITNEIANALTTIERARGFLDAATLSEDWIGRMSKRALLLEAHHTTHIEGTHLTLEQAQKLWEGKTVKNADPDDTRELLNYREAFNLVCDYISDRGPVTEGVIREIHKQLVKGVRGGQGRPGEYRNVQNYVVNGLTGSVVYTPPPPTDVAPLMRELVGWLNTGTSIHPVLVSGIAQFQLVHIHPFIDGNGRTSRLLSTLCLYRAGYDFKRLFTISEYYDRDRTAFYCALQGVREHDMDLTGWLEFFVKGLSTQLDEVKVSGEHVIRADVLANKHNLNSRQAKAVGYLLEHEKLQVEEFEKVCPGVNRRTLQRDIQVLVGKHILSSHGDARARHYSLKINNK
ncbi:MAG: Fic family protein [Victivallales bacterium]|jgi:Fic family protein